MCHGYIVLRGDFAAHGVDDSGGESERAGGWCASAREIDFGDGREVGRYFGWSAVREEKTYVAGEVRGEEVR